MNNESILRKLTCKVTVNSWLEQIKSENFKQWYKQIMIDFRGDEKRSFAPEFRNIVISEAANASSKGRGTFDGCRDFILEECAHACAYLKDTVIAYPMPLSEAMLNTIKRYDLNLLHLHYNISYHARKRQCITRDYSQITQKLFELLTGIMKVNFYVTDKFGNFIYKNNTISHIVGEVPADIIDPTAWKISQKVIETGKQIIAEEQYQDICFCSVKAPLIINDEIEGIIGIAIDITDRKKAEELKAKIVLQNKIKDIFEKFVRSINPTLTELSITIKNNKNLTEEECIDITSKAIGIQSIINELQIALQENKLDNLKL